MHALLKLNQSGSNFLLIQPLVNPERRAVMNNHINKVHRNQLTGTTHMLYISFIFHRLLVLKDDVNHIIQSFKSVNFIYCSHQVQIRDNSSRDGSKTQVISVIKTWECVAFSINICPWQDPMQFGIKVTGTPCSAPGCRWNVKVTRWIKDFPIHIKLHHCSYMWSAMTRRCMMLFKKWASCVPFENSIWNNVVKVFLLLKLG